MSKNYSNNFPNQQRPQREDFTRVPQYDRNQRERHRLQWIGGIFIIFVFLLSLFGYLNLQGEMQNYPQIGSGNLTWQICAIEPRPYHWHVAIQLVDKQGKVLAHQSLFLTGEQVKLQAETLNLLGTPSAYKLISTEGFYTNPRDERNSSYPRNTISLDDGKTPLFSVANAQSWLSGLVHALIIQPLVLNKDGKTYNLYETQNGIKLVAEKNSLPLCGFTHLSA